MNICFHQCPDFTHAIQNNNNNDNALICLDKNPEGYYLDIDGFYKKCFKNCKFCFGPWTEIDNNCTICKPNYFFFDDSSYKNNCYQKCPHYYYFAQQNRYICTNNFTGIHDKLINSRNKCIDKCENDNIYKYEYNNICYKECSDDINKNIEEKIWYNISIFKFINITNMEIFGKNEDIYKDIVNNVLINNNISKGEELIIPGNDNFYFHITNSKNDIELLNEKNNNKTNKFSIIDLGICEDLLKEH